MNKIVFKQNIQPIELLVSTHQIYDYNSRCLKNLQRDTNIMYSKARVTLMGLKEFSTCNVTDYGDYSVTYGTPTRALYFR